ncbi:unnamed protein product [Zymoseptoria tritici ST99CH_3D7]|uniref:Hydrophobin n=1 Tax=Zymoseptoria tritici (strain ST99CH_3D7) TaxID=1276538 RepID=A0A1X7S643_ZYMT9|nr:unnamed protein product [Zymoseptoria tritici ST99CH_3D7]
MKTFFAIAASAAMTLAAPAVQDPAAPTCRDGGQLHCCQATFTGSAAPVTLAADLVCYDLTPAVLNCIITKAPIDPEFGCVGEYACCQVNDLDPVLGLYCSKPPGDCIGREGGDPASCTEVLEGRFGNCTDNDVRNNQGLLGIATKPLKGLTGLVGGGKKGGLLKD